jgi:hypothetical protein
MLIAADSSALNPVVAYGPEAGGPEVIFFIPWKAAHVPATGPGPRERGPLAGRGG